MIESTQDCSCCRNVLIICVQSLFVVGSILSIVQPCIAKVQWLVGMKFAFGAFTTEYKGSLEKCKEFLLNGSLV